MLLAADASLVSRAVEVACDDERMKGCSVANANDIEPVRAVLHEEACEMLELAEAAGLEAGEPAYESDGDNEQTHGAAGAWDTADSCSDDCPPDEPMPPGPAACCWGRFRRRPCRC